MDRWRTGFAARKKQTRNRSNEGFYCESITLAQSCFWLSFCCPCDSSFWNALFGQAFPTFQLLVETSGFRHHHIVTRRAEQGHGVPAARAIARFLRGSIRRRPDRPRCAEGLPIKR